MSLANATLDSNGILKFYFLIYFSLFDLFFEHTKNKPNQRNLTGLM